MQYECTVRKAAIFLITESEDTANQWQTFILEAQIKKKHMTRGNFFTSPHHSYPYCLLYYGDVITAVLFSVNQSRRAVISVGNYKIYVACTSKRSFQTDVLVPAAGSSTSACTQHLPSDAPRKDRSTSATSAGLYRGMGAASQGLKLTAVI